MTAVQERVAFDTASFSDPRAWPDRKEKSDGYSGEIVRYGKHRIILCRDGIQWIIQKDRRPKLVITRREPLHYCTTKKALMRLWATSEPSSGAIPALDALPDSARFMGRAKS